MLIRYIRSNFGREVNITGKMILSAFDVQVRKVSDLSGMQVILLMMLKCDERMTMEQASKDTGTFGDELHALLRPLFEKGYIDYVENDVITLTSEGERALAYLWSIVEQAEERVLAGFSEAEKQQLSDFLRRIQANCETLTGTVIS